MDDSKTRRHSSVLAAAGAGFLVLAGFFLWRDLALPRELVLLAAVVVSGAATLLRWPRLWPAVAPSVLFGATALGAAWYAMERSPAVLPALAAAAAVAAAAVVQLELRPPAARAGWSGQVTWYAFGAALLASTWALYFTFFTTGFAADSVARRLNPHAGVAGAGAGDLPRGAAAHAGRGARGRRPHGGRAHQGGGLRHDPPARIAAGDGAGGGGRAVAVWGEDAADAGHSDRSGPSAAPARKGVA